MMFRFLLCFLMIFILIIACEDEYYGKDITDGNIFPADYIETDVSLSPDRDYIYFSVRDTIDYYYGGINRARVTNPIRERVLPGYNFYSPTINFDDNILAYLYDGRIHYYDITEDTIMNSGIIGEFESIVYVNLDVLLAARNDSIFLTNEVDSSYQYLRDGWDPTLVAANTFLFFASLDNYTFRLIKDDLGGSNPETLLTVQSAVFVRWPTLDPNSGHLVFSVDSIGQFFIYSGIAGAESGPEPTLTYIDSSEHSKAYILNSNQIVFSGPNGSLYQSDFEGIETVPFVHIEISD